MKPTSQIVAALIVLAACRADVEDALTEFRAVEAAMCACRDAACAARVTERMLKVGERHQRTRVTEAQMREAVRITEAVAACHDRAVGHHATAAPAPR